MNQPVGGDYIGGDKIGGDKITIGNVTSSVVSIHQRALTLAEEAGIARDLERQSLAQGVQRLASSLRAQLDTSNTGIAPFKDLLPYELNDAEMFFGRQQAIQELLACLERGRLTVLHAESGAGKTSLLQAGVAPRLFAQGNLALALRSGHEDPALVVRQAFLPDPSSAPGLAGAPLQAFLCRVGEILGPGCRLYLFLDQFEEFFRLEKDERSSFGRSLAQCLDDPGLDVRWAVALRAEAFRALAELEESGIAPFKNAHRLNRMGRDEARLAIQEPGRRAGLNFQPELVETLLNDLGGKGEISPVHLSLVCSALSAGAAQNQPVTMQSLEKEGGVEGILRGYLQRQIGTLPPEQREPARRVLRALVSADKRRTTKNISLLTGELIRQKISPPLLRDLLNRLVERRLVVAHESDAGVSYELAHDYLLGEIELDPAEQARKAAQELLDQEVRAYQRHGALIDAERLALIERYRAELQVSEEAGALLAQSRAAVEQEAAEEEVQRQHELAQARRLAETRRQRAMVLAAGLVVAIFLAILSFSFMEKANSAATQAAQNLATAQTQEANAKTQEAIANTQKGIAETQEAIAKEQAQIALGRQLAAQSQALPLDTGTRTLTGGLLAAESLRRVPGLEADQAARRVLGLLGRPVSYVTHKGAVRAVAFSPDGSLVVSGGDDGIARVWESASEREVAKVEHKGGVNAVAFSPDGSRVVSGGKDGIARVWEAASGREVAVVGHKGGVNAVAFSPDGSQAVSGGDDGIARVREVEGGREVSKTLDGAVTAVAFSPDGSLVALGSKNENYEKTARVWEVATGREVVSKTLLDGAVTAVAFSPDGSLVVSGSLDGSASVWEVETGNVVAQMGHGQFVTAVAFSPKGDTVVSGGSDCVARVWKAKTGEMVAQMAYTKVVSAVAFSPDGDRVVSASADGTARVWESASGREVARIVHEAGVNAVAFSPDGSRVISGGNDGIARVWEVPRMVREEKVHVVAFSPDASQVVSGGDDGIVHVWEVESGREVVSKTYGDAVHAVAFSPNGSQVVWGGDGGIARVWDVKSGREVSKTLDGFVNAVAFSPNRPWVVSGSGNTNFGTTSVWEAATGQAVMSKEFIGGFVNAVAFSPDGRWMVSGGDDTMVHVWDTSNWKKEKDLEHEAPVIAIAFSPDGKWVVVVSNDGTIRVWASESWRELARIGPDKALETIKAIAFSLDGRRVVSWNSDNTSLEWLWQPKDLLAELCTRLTRNLTQAEWTQYLGDEPYRATCPNLPVPAAEQ